jgi:hypothetical protein
LAHEERSGSKDSSQDGGSTGDETGINMIFMLPAEFRAPEAEVAEFALGANVVTIDKPDRLGQHMKPLFVKGYVEGRPVWWIMIDGGTGVNVMPVSTFKKMGFGESELMKTNTSLSAFIGATTETKGVLSVELTEGSKTTPMAFFVVDVFLSITVGKAPTYSFFMN